MTRGIRREVKLCLDRVGHETRQLASRPGIYAGGLASEGYAGGYAQALRDVLLLLSGITPNSRYWSSEDRKRFEGHVKEETHE